MEHVGAGVTEATEGSLDPDARLRVAINTRDRQVATKLGYTTPQFISNWERGVSHPPMNILKKLAQTYKVDADIIFEMLLSDTIEGLTLDMKKEFFGRKAGA